MKEDCAGFLIRVGIDTTNGNIGYCAPVFPDDSFEYIPLPEFADKTTEENTYGTMEARNKKYGQFLSDFMHEDCHRFSNPKDGNRLFIGSVDENCRPLLAKDMKPHFDPEFKTNTFGDSWKRDRGRIPPELKDGQYLFFYSGLSRYDAQFYKTKRTWEDVRNFQVGNKCVFLIGFFKIREIFDFNIKDEKALEEHKEEISNNAHYKGYAWRPPRHPCVIIKGEDYPESRLLTKALQLNTYSPRDGMYIPTQIGMKIRFGRGRGVRITKWLDEKEAQALLNAIDEKE